jgi:CDGSH-type Zn-finger protein
MSEDAAAGNAANGEGPLPARRRAEDGALVTVYEDGPLIVRGRFAITGQDGEPIPADRRTVALCRCGRSAIKPFCDGSHARTGFRAPGGRQRPRAAQDPGRGRGTRQPLAGVADAAPEAAGHGQPAAD